MLTTEAVTPAAIQDKLNAIWESLETAQTTRASLFNLVFYSKKNARTPYVQKLAEKIVEKFPSRVIFITADDISTEDSLKTGVSILSAKQGECDVACDYIQIDAAGSAQVRIPFVVLPHIVPDLPVYLIWAEDPCVNNPIFAELNAFATRIIYDSEATEHLSSFCKSILDHHEKTHTDIADLNWARIESWRELFSMAFYSEEELHCVQRAKHIALTFNAHASQFFCHTRIQSIYLQAWIACQLNWKCTESRMEKDRIHFSYQSTFGPVTVVLNPLMNPDLPPGLITNLDIVTLDEHTVAFSRDPKEIHRISLKSFDSKKCAIPATYILQKAESGHSLVKEVTHRDTSRHFLKVIRLLGTC